MTGTSKAELIVDPRRLPPDIALELGYRGAARIVYDSEREALILRTVDEAGELVERVTIGAGVANPEIVFNMAGEDIDVRFEGDTDPELMFIDAEGNRIGVGGAPDPAIGGLKLHVRGRMRVEVDNSDFFTLYRPTAVPGAGADLVFAFQDSTGSAQTYGAVTGILQDATEGSEDGRIGFFTTRSGAFAQRMKLGDGLVVGTPTNDDRGAGTINAEAVYDDNVLLTCYPLDAAYGDGIDIEEWDAIAASSKGQGAQHPGARRFDARALDLGWFADFVRHERRLPAMPSKSEADAPVAVGDYMNRVLETLDILAVHVASLHERVVQIERQLEPVSARAD